MCRRPEQCRIRADETRPQGFLQRHTAHFARCGPFATHPGPGRSGPAEQPPPRRPPPRVSAGKPAPDNPLQLWAAVSEAVLLQRVGGPHVMNAQLKHLLASSGHLHVAIQVLPH
ncbi:Scr1 family TA system antitoxin-like transcriptional regulator [Streptomyces sp. CLV115]|uniref:Scr1 family TA system antitoxin-like transcriptional regulator n=1 Tax=Streptomyces sp. CLV115 TaxID=3138502 RepID=UPI00313BCD27